MEHLLGQVILDPLGTIIIDHQSNEILLRAVLQFEIVSCRFVLADVGFILCGFIRLFRIRLKIS